MQLRPYQLEAIEAIETDFLFYEKLLLILPTGTGKTVVFNKIATDFVKNNKKVLILAHREELIMQAHTKLEQQFQVFAGIEKASSFATHLDMVVVASVQTLAREKRLNQWDKDNFDLIIVDEAHHALSETYKIILNYFSSAKLLGVTATPDRGDKRCLGKIFEEIAYEYYLPNAIKDKFLAPIRCITSPLEINLGKLTTKAGDYSESEVAEKIEPYFLEIIAQIKRYAINRKIIIFLPLVRISQKFCNLLNENNFSACEVNANTLNRKEILKDFKEGKYNVICNSMLLTEGFDEPSIDCVINLRATKVRSLYTQIVGRGTRICEGKKDLLLLDFLWISEDLNLCKPINLISKCEEITAKANKKSSANPGEELDLIELGSESESEVVQDREKALAEKLKAQRSKKSKECDPLQYFLSIKCEDLINYIPEMPWEYAPVSDNQKKFLEKSGMNLDEIGCCGLATKVIEKIELRRKLGLSTPKQIKLLERYNYKNVAEMSFDNASNLITRIASNNWRRV